MCVYKYIYMCGGVYVLFHLNTLAFPPSLSLSLSFSLSLSLSLSLVFFSFFDLALSSSS